MSLYDAIVFGLKLRCTGKYSVKNFVNDKKNQQYYFSSYKIPPISGKTYPVNSSICFSTFGKTSAVNFR